MSPRLRPIASLALPLVALVLAGCSAPNAAPDRRLTVVATTTQLGDFARNVVGDSPVRVVQLLEPNQSAHGFDPSVAQITEVGGADLLLSNGGGLEPWLDDVIAASGFEGAAVVTARERDFCVASDAAGSCSKTDPHVWHDVHKAMSQVKAVSTAITEADPTIADTVQMNTTAYLDRLEGLDAWIHENVDPVPVEQRLLVTNHDAFGHMVDALELTFVGAIIPSTNDKAEPSAAELDALITAIKESGAQAVFAESSISPKAAEALARETGAQVYDGETALYSDSLGPAGTAGESYIGSEVSNLTTLMASWGLTASTPGDFVND